jgi:hypothetical protein
MADIIVPHEESKTLYWVDDRPFQCKRPRVFILLLEPPIIEATCEDLAHRTSELCRLPQRCWCEVAVAELPICRAKEIVGHRIEKVCRYAFAGSA